MMTLLILANVLLPVKVLLPLSVGMPVIVPPISTFRKNPFHLCCALPRFHPVVAGKMLLLTVCAMQITDSRRIMNRCFFTGLRKCLGHCCGPLQVNFRERRCQSFRSPETLSSPESWI